MRTNGIKKNHKIYIFKHQQTESGGGGGANLEDNKTATIDVSAYTGPVAINPTAGKDGMKKATVTLSNIPSGGSTAYAWVNDNDDVQYTDFAIAPETLTSEKSLRISSGVIMVGNFGGLNYTKISDTSFSFGPVGREVVYTRDSDFDFTLWQE